MATNLRDKETQALSSMLTLSSKDGFEEFGDQWKVLIFDRDSRDVISPLLNPSALRQKGVTLYLLIDSEREQIPDAPAIYLVRPTKENINRIVSDCSRQLYRCFHIHFLTRIEKSLLEDFAQMLVQVGNPTIPTLIKRVVDEYLDVQSLEPNLFSLNIPDSYQAYADPKLEVQIPKFMKRIEMSLLSLIRVMNAVPIIRCASDSLLTKDLATNFCKLLQENLHPKGPASSLLQNSLISDRPRPLLLIFDRSNDFAPLLQHNSTYQALIDDLLDHRNNRVTIEIKSDKEASSGGKKTYDLNTQHDAFLSQYCRVLFPEAIEANTQELATVSKIEKDMKSRPQDESKAISSLSDAIESLPEVLARKANLETHTNILEAVMASAKLREVPSYIEVEQALLTPVSLSSTVSSKLSACYGLLNSTKGLLEDKGRLYLLAVIFLCSNSSSGSKENSDEKELDNAFTAGCESIPAPNAPTKEAIEKVKAAGKKLKETIGLRSPFGAAPSSYGGGASSAVNNLTSTTNAVFSSIFAKATSFFTRGSPMSITRIVDNISEGRSCAENDSYLYLDPRDSKSPTQQLDSRHRESSTIISKFSEVIVFVVGGGCYAEYDNLQDLVKEKAKAAADSGVSSLTSHAGLRSVVYGATEIINGDRFLKQLQNM